LKGIIMHNDTLIVAEVKTQSPFGFRSQDSWEVLFVLANEVGDMLSIHTDPRWGGSFDLVRKAKNLTKKPVLAKGIHATDDDIRRAVDAGADAVLVVGRIPEIHIDTCWLEPNSIAGLRALPSGSRAVWNARNLVDGGAKKESFAEARAAFRGWLCQASFIRSVHDILPGADAALIGTDLRAFASSLG
jgi:hypothetical protein